MRLTRHITQFSALTLLLGTLSLAQAHTTSQQRFINKLLPEIRLVNRAILSDRTRLLKLETTKPTPQDRSWRRALAKAYHIPEFNPAAVADRQLLLVRVDMVPAGLVLAQAAHESAWGTSRFAKAGNNFFGQWCFRAGCGLVPKQRPAGAHHEARVFPSVKAAIAAYMHNLNTNPAYTAFRQLRATTRKHQQPLNSLKLAPGIERYNPARQAYVARITTTITRYHLTQYDATPRSKPQASTAAK